MDNKLEKAINILSNKCGVIPKAYSMYNDSYFFMAFPKSLPKEKWKEYMTPFYLVDLKLKCAGQFSRMMDPVGYDNCINKLKKL